MPWGESPFRDIAGYALLGIANHQVAQVDEKALRSALTAMRCGEPIPTNPMDLYRETLVGIRAEIEPKKYSTKRYTGARLTREDGCVGILVVKQGNPDEGWYTDNVGQGYDAEQYGEYLLFDPELVRAVLDGHADVFHQIVAAHYDMASAPPFDRLEVRWIKLGQVFRVSHEDGGERIVYSLITKDAYAYPTITVDEAKEPA